MDFLQHSWLFIAGFILQGESALIFWLLSFAGQPTAWPLILSIAGALSFFSFEFYFYLGRAGDSLLRKPPLRALGGRVNRLPNFSRPAPVILTMRFLYGIRNIIALWLGIRRYRAARFALLNLTGDALWLGVWFMIFYLFRAAAGNFLVTYQNILLLIYLFLIGGILLWQFIRRIFRRALPK